MISKDVFFEYLSKGREDNYWDFKRDLKLKPNEDFYQLLKDILAFSNTEGGYLLLGVEDKDHELVGVTNQIDEAELGNKIRTTLGYSIDVKLLYFKHDYAGDTKVLGILYIPKTKKVNLSPKDLTGQKGTIVQANFPYVRRNTQSVIADKEDLERIMKQTREQEEYEFKERDLKILKRNKDSYDNDFGRILMNYLRGDFKFTTNVFSDKINWLYYTQTKYNKLEFGRLVGFEDHKIDDYFEGRAFPTLEQILRINLVFELPADYFFRPTINSKFPIWQDPLISYFIIDKVTNKTALLYRDKGEFFSDVFESLSNGIRNFLKWSFSDIPKDLNQDPIEKFFSTTSYQYLYDCLQDWSNEKIEEFKEHLSHQHYKIFEWFSTDEHIEEILSTIINLDTDCICRLIIECIKDITITDDGTPIVNLHFIEEIKNKEYNGREFKSDWTFKISPK
ncbi:MULTISPECIES: AlbA family DNA-binding domain-containing protein [Bacillus]|uniref:AlbA family DNA-binding domain-containing protein n=1 Tax=Bacillus TaxID=1386 RepID=UPI001BAA85C6|nr:ATP-binding protein [Bacillus subtilis]MBR0008320.1 ATP-binding protein [Bacillus subtilis]